MRDIVRGERAIEAAVINIQEPGIGRVTTSIESSFRVTDGFAGCVGDCHQRGAESLLVLHLQGVKAGMPYRVAFIEKRCELRIGAQQLRALNRSLGQSSGLDDAEERIRNQVVQPRAKSQILVRELVLLSRESSRKAYARATGKVGVGSVTCGPGYTPKP